MSDSVRPHRRQPTRLPRPWDSPGKNTGVSCHFLLQCMKVKSESEVTQSCPTLLNPMDCSPPGPPSMVFSRQEYWSGVPLPSPKLNYKVSKTYNKTVTKIIQSFQNQLNGIKRMVLKYFFKLGAQIFNFPIEETRAPWRND